MSDFEEVEPSLAREAVERRGEPRGPVRDMTATVRDAEYQALEASRKGVFVAVGDPDNYRLGEILSVSIHRGDRTVEFKGEVARKEIHPRRGIAVRVLFLTPSADEELARMVDPVAS